MKILPKLILGFSLTLASPCWPQAPSEGDPARGERILTAISVSIIVLGLGYKVVKALRATPKSTLSTRYQKALELYLAIEQEPLATQYELFKKSCTLTFDELDAYLEKNRFDRDTTLALYDLKDFIFEMERYFAEQDHPEVVGG